MIGCAVTADLARYERELDRADFAELVADRVVPAHRAELAKRLLALKGWVAAAVEKRDDTLASLTQAIDYACRGDHLQASQLLCETFERAANAHADELLEDAVNDYSFDLQATRRGNARPSEPTAKNINLSEYED